MNNKYFYAGPAIKIKRFPVEKRIIKAVCCGNQIGSSFCPRCGKRREEVKETIKEYPYLREFIKEDIDGWYNTFDVACFEGGVEGLKKGECYLFPAGKNIDPDYDEFTVNKIESIESSSIVKDFEKWLKYFEGKIEYEKPELIAVLYGEY